MTTRREFIVRLSTGLCALALNGACKGGTASRRVRFGIISDVHQDLQPDAIRRLQAFVKAAQKQELDFIIQLGDLSHGDGLDKIKAVWEQYPGKKYSVLGNHDMDHATKAIVTDALNMPGSYYSFDLSGVHFVILDLNHVRKDGKLLDYDH